MDFLAIFGGSFNPFHNGHAHIIQYVFNHTSYEHIMLVCNNKNPLKTIETCSTNLPSAKQRLEMLALGIKNMFHVSIYSGEIERGGISYTIDTVIDIYRKNIFNIKTPPTISDIKEAINSKNVARVGLIIGSDIIEDLHRWYRVDDLLSVTTLLIFPRAEFYKTSHLLVKNLCGNIKADTIEYHLFSPEEMISISSHDIRMSGEKDNYSIYKSSIPKLVYKYIQERKFYIKSHNM